MKTKGLFPAVLLLSMNATGQQHLETAVTDSTGKPGDNFNLSAALSLFKRSIDVGNFERALNDTAGHVNNLDLDHNGNVDYLRVVDHADGDAHALVMQVPVNGTEMQDVAVIELEHPGTDSAVVQIHGSMDLYGTDVVMEPFEEVPEHAAYKGPAAPPDRFANVSINVWSWPCVRSIYAPGYAPWVSPWGWRHYPAWWRLQQPLPWSAYWGWSVRYHRFCRSVRVIRTVRAHNVYLGHRMGSTALHRAP